MNVAVTLVNTVPPPQRVQSVDRAVGLLEALAAAPEPETAPALADRCALNRSTAWRILATLEHHGLVERDPVTHRYRIGYAVVRLAAGAGHEPLIRMAHPALRALAEATGETVSLAVPRQLQLFSVDQLQGAQVMAADWLGRSTPLHATSTGKAFLAWLDAAELDAVLSQPLERFTAATTCTPAALRRELAGVRANGWSASRGELEPGLWGVSAAALDRWAHPVAVVSVWGAEARLRRHGLPALGARTAAAAQAIGAAAAGLADEGRAA